MFADPGETSLRWFEDPVRPYELRWREADAYENRHSHRPDAPYVRLDDDDEDDWGH